MRRLSGSQASKREQADCKHAQELMSAFIDSMTTPEETERLKSHLETCEPCQRQLQSFVSVRNLMAGMSVEPPQDLVLESRVRLSHERTRSNYNRWHTRLSNMLKPLAVPALAGVSVTVICFGILLGSFVTSPEVYAANIVNIQDPMYDPPRMTDPMITRLGTGYAPSFDGTLSIQTDLSDAGRVFDYRIISGTRSPAVDTWIQQMVLLAQFKPATSWGSPAPARIILSFVEVRS